MKTLRFIGMALAALALGVCVAACGDDDDDDDLDGGNGGTIRTETTVTLETAGTLSLWLGDKVRTTTSLKINGPLNGDDIICLRQMLRCTDEDIDTRGMLTVLDLSDASIVAGGDSYYSGTHTSNDYIGDYMFRNCESLEKIALPNSVTTIGSYAFRDCTSLTQVTIGNSVTTIGHGAFYGCTGLTQVTIGNSVTSIFDYAFCGCTSLTQVTIGNSVTTIGANAFYYCTSLTEVTIPNSVTTIGGGAFDGCKGLKSITSLNPEPPTCRSSNVFYNVPTSTCVLNVPAGSKGAYSTASVWRDFTNIVEI